MTTLVGWVENEYWNLINFTMFIPLFSRLRAFVSFLLLLPLMACCGSSQSVAQTDGLGTFSMAEVAKHNTEKSAWMAIDGLVCVFVTISLFHSLLLMTICYFLHNSLQLQHHALRPPRRKASGAKHNHSRAPLQVFCPKTCIHMSFFLIR